MRLTVHATASELIEDGQALMSAGRLLPRTQALILSHACCIISSPLNADSALAWYVLRLCFAPHSMKTLPRTPQIDMHPC